MFKTCPCLPDTLPSSHPVVEYEGRSKDLAALTTNDNYCESSRFDGLERCKIYKWTKDWLNKNKPSETKPESTASMTPTPAPPAPPPAPSPKASCVIVSEFFTFMFEIRRIENWSGDNEDKIKKGA